MERLTQLWKGAAYQDNLLQSYRGFHLTIQSILIAVGTGLSIAVLTFTDLPQVWGSYVILIAITSLGVYLLWSMHGLIKARGVDVDYFHNEIILQEQSLPKKEQVLTAFKVEQKFNRGKVDIHEYFESFELTPAICNQLTEKGKGHTRKLLDKYLSWGFYAVWACLHTVSLWRIAELTA
ncbi:hypothetical protein [Marinoscillum sp.]|uniref:hypothetical protein n=1 Tax=Marinoscillum sp. TaxID=2024838 RepID=UPI003BAA1DB4